MSELRPFPVPSNEHARVQVIDLLDLEARRDDPFFDHVLTLVRGLFGAPVAFVSLIGGDCQRLLRIDGVDMDETPRSMSLCAFTVAEKRTIVIPDTHADPRSRNHPIVTQPSHLRFSASAPVILSSGICVGTLCAIDFAPRPMPAPDVVAQLEGLAAMTARFYELPIEPDPVREGSVSSVMRQAQDEFLSLVSHELRTPLNGIQGLAQLVEGADPDEAEMMEALRQSADHLGAIVENIVSFSQLRTGEMAIREERIDVAALMASSQARFVKLAAVRERTLRVEDIADALTITGDPALLGLAVDCLTANMILHGGATGTLEAYLRDDGGVTLGFADDGDGIAPGRRAAVFDAFEIGAPLGTRTADGLGLGLPLSLRIVEMHGGMLDVVDGPGTTARIRLPVWRSVPRD